MILKVVFLFQSFLVMTKFLVLLFLYQFYKFSLLHKHIFARKKEFAQNSMQFVFLLETLMRTKYTVPLKFSYPINNVKDIVVFLGLKVNSVSSFPCKNLVSDVAMSNIKGIQNYLPDTLAIDTYCLFLCSL